MAQGYNKAFELPQVIPIFPLPGSILLSRGQLPLNIFEPRYLNMIDDAMAGDRLIGMIQPIGQAGEKPPLTRVGCAGKITSFAETSDGRYLITLTGICRFGVVNELQVKTPYRQVRADFTPFEADLSQALQDIPEFSRDGFLQALRPYLQHRGLQVDWSVADVAPPEALINSLAMALPFDPREKQALLEAPTLTARAEALTALLHIDASDIDPDDGPAIQ